MNKSSSMIATLAVILMAGCSTVKVERSTEEGAVAAAPQAAASAPATKVVKKETIECGGWDCASTARPAPRVILVVPDGGYDTGPGRGWYPDYRGRHYRGSYRIEPGQACSGPFGQTWHGICYPYEPPWRLN